jgi:hypothetical protein
MKRVLIVAAMLATAASAQAAGPCKLQRMAMVDAEVDGSDHLFIPAELAGRATKLMVDTGGAWSLIKSDLVDELKLERHVNQQLRLVDASGT